MQVSHLVNLNNFPESTKAREAHQPWIGLLVQEQIIDLINTAKMHPALIERVRPHLDRVPSLIEMICKTDMMPGDRSIYGPKGFQEHEIPMLVLTVNASMLIGHVGPLEYHHNKFEEQSHNYDLWNVIAGLADNNEKHACDTIPMVMAWKLGEDELGELNSRIATAKNEGFFPCVVSFIAKTETHSGGFIMMAYMPATYERQRLAALGVAGQG
jgi:hypothetical protein